MCTLARDKRNTGLSRDILRLMSSTILRRLTKLGSSTPDWLSEMALKTYTYLGELLDIWLMRFDAPRSPFQNPSQDELIRDTRLLLRNSRKHIDNILANDDHKSVRTAFIPHHRRRGTVEDFLSLDGTFFDEAYAADPDVTLYDVERWVEGGIDDWLACVRNVDDACAQLELLMDKYVKNAFKPMQPYSDCNPERVSRRLLTAIELYVALDKLAVKEIPMLADYPPAIPTTVLEHMLLREGTSLHRLSCAYQYLSLRHRQSHAEWSVFSNEFAIDSFPVRYYDQSPDLQRLKARIEEDMKNVAVSYHLHYGPGVADLTCAHDGYEQYVSGQRPAASEEAVLLPLPASPLHAKAIVFELRCPACIRIWRSAASRILYCFDSLVGGLVGGVMGEHHLLAHLPAFQPYMLERKESRLHFQIHCAYFYTAPSQSLHSPTVCYVVQHPDSLSEEDHLSIWLSERLEDRIDVMGLPSLEYNSCFFLNRFVDFSSHTPNDVMSAQADCPTNLSLEEYIAFAHLRSGGSLQWLNILHGLRSRTLNLRHPQVHFLLSYTAFQVGPLDLNTGMWIWHQELQDSSFSNALLDELEDLFIDVGAASMDGVLVNSISLLLGRVLASQPSEDVSERAIALLRRIRQKTFRWVQEISYDLAMAPMDGKRSNLLRDMAAACRSMFHIEPAILHKLLYSAEDVDALLSCAFFICGVSPPCKSNSKCLVP